MSEELEKIREAFKAAKSHDLPIHIMSFGGNCPVQIEGTIGGIEFYFRARWETWTIGIGGDPVMDPAWGYEEDYGDGPYDAGWMTQVEALGFLAKALGMFVAEINGEPEAHQ